MAERGGTAAARAERASCAPLRDPRKGRLTDGSASSPLRRKERNLTTFRWFDLSVLGQFAGIRAQMGPSHTRRRVRAIH
jgi:hypothetical protein